MNKNFIYFFCSIVFFGLYLLLPTSAADRFPHSLSPPLLNFAKLDDVGSKLNIKYKKVQRMNSIMFNFRPDLPPEKQKVLLEQINTWNGISKAGHLKPNAQNSVIARMCYAYVNETEELKVLMEKLSALPEIESVSIPATRQLLTQ
jgi:hypothetical protein